MRKFIIRTNLKKGTVEIDVSKKSQKDLKKAFKKLGKEKFSDKAVNIALAMEVPIYLNRFNPEVVTNKKGKNTIVTVYEVGKKPLKEAIEFVVNRYIAMNNTVITFDVGYANIAEEVFTEEEAEEIIEQILEENAQLEEAAVEELLEELVEEGILTKEDEPVEENQEEVFVDEFEEIVATEPEPETPKEKKKKKKKKHK